MASGRSWRNSLPSGPTVGILSAAQCITILEDLFDLYNLKSYLRVFSMGACCPAGLRHN